MAGGEPVPNPATQEDRQLKGKTSSMLSLQSLYVLWGAAADGVQEGQAGSQVMSAASSPRWQSPHLDGTLLSRNGQLGDPKNVIGNLCDHILSIHFFVWTSHPS